MSIVTFGHYCNSLSEWRFSCGIIENAFTSYRERLSSFMVELNAITCRVTEIENEYGNVGIHYEMYINAVTVSSKKKVSLVLILWEKMNFSQGAGSS